MTTMNYDLALHTLFRHSNLPVTDPALDPYGLVYCVSSIQWDSHPPDPREIVATFAKFANEIIECLECINKDINGDLPSSNTGERKVLDTRLVLAVSQIVTDCMFSLISWRLGGNVRESILSGLARATWTVACGWNAILHGDIDSLEEHVALESPFFESTE
jgi:hypothetical protein